MSLSISLPSLYTLMYSHFSAKKLLKHGMESLLICTIWTADCYQSGKPVCIFDPEWFFFKSDNIFFCEGP